MGSLLAFNHNLMSLKDTIFLFARLLPFIENIPSSPSPQDQNGQWYSNSSMYQNLLLITDSNRVPEYISKTS